MPRSNESNASGGKAAQMGKKGKPARMSRRGKLAVLLTLVLFFLPVIAVKVYIWKYPLRWCNDTGVKFVWARNFVRKNHGAGYNVVVLGDSDTNAAFAPELLGEDVLDLAVFSTEPHDDYYVFKEYLSHNQAP
ncbi:MAG: hypothetical protein IJU95_02190, partial [Treponema sp.]|nr:hypothetical protein [Treponema sp.]